MEQLWFLMCVHVSAVERVLKCLDDRLGWDCGKNLDKERFSSLSYDVDTKSHSSEDFSI